MRLDLGRKLNLCATNRGKRRECYHSYCCWSLESLRGEVTCECSRIVRLIGDAELDARRQVQQGD